MKYRVTHHTAYDYNESISLCHNEAHLKPRNAAYQRCLSSEFSVEPLPAVLHHRTDLYGNHVSFFSIQSPHKSLTVKTVSNIELKHPNTSELPTLSLPWEKVQEILQIGTEAEVIEAREFIMESPFISTSQDLYDYTRLSFTPERPILDATRDLMRRVYTDFSYDPNFTTIVTPLETVLEHRKGVCQDFAHLMIGGIRSMGLAARYVSGYLETLPPPGQEKLQGSDASHAWIAVYVPHKGWIDFDPTNNQLPGNQHITTAWGRDYSDVTPLKGVIFGGGNHVLRVSVDVCRLEDSEEEGVLPLNTMQQAVM